MSPISRRQLLGAAAAGAAAAVLPGAIGAAAPPRSATATPRSRRPARSPTCSTWSS